jgi:hypothetical protein
MTRTTVATGAARDWRGAHEWLRGERPRGAPLGQRLVGPRQLLQPCLLAQRLR